MSAEVSIRTHTGDVWAIKLDEHGVRLDKNRLFVAYAIKGDFLTTDLFLEYLQKIFLVIETQTENFVKEYCKGDHQQLPEEMRRGPHLPESE